MAAKKPTTKPAGKKKTAAKAARKPAPKHARSGQTVRGHIAVGRDITPNAT